MDTLITIIGTIGAIVGIGSAISSAYFSWRNLVERREQEVINNQRIAITLIALNERYKLPASIRREELTRPEVLGRIGMIPLTPEAKEKQNGRFDLPVTNTPEFIEAIARVREDVAQYELEIHCKADALKQFDLPESPATSPI